MTTRFFTLVSGYDTDDENPHPIFDTDARIAWVAEHFKVYTLPGRWREESIAKFVDRRGLKKVDYEYKTHNL